MVQVAKTAFFEVPVRWFELQFSAPRIGFVRPMAAMEPLENGGGHAFSQEGSQQEHDPAPANTNRPGRLLNEIV